MKFRFRVGVTALLISVSLAATGLVQAAIYSQDFSFPDNTTDLGDGSSLASSTSQAFVTGGKLQLTSDAVGSTLSGYVIPSLGPEATESWIATFDFSIFDTPGGNAPADGFNFSHGPIDFGRTAGEEGFGVGLSIEFDTWNNGADEAGHNVAVNNVDVPGGFNELDPDATGLERSAVITWERTGDDSGIVSVFVDDEEIFVELETPGFDPQDDYNFAFGARTGGATEDFLIDNLVIEAPIGRIGPSINGSGETYLQNFDEMGTDKKLPNGWRGTDTAGSSTRADSLGLVDGPLEGAVVSAAGVVNVGGNTERFSIPGDGRLGTWKDDLDNSTLFDEGDVIADAATDRALGNGRVLDDDAGSLAYEVEIVESPVRALTLEWDLEIWGGDPESVFRGSEGGGYIAQVSVNGNVYHEQTVTLHPGDLFDSSFDGSPNNTHDPTLINGNEHAVRGNATGIVEVSSADGAVGNLVNLNFDGNHGGADGGWISAIDNVQLRALAAGDAQADGDVDPADLIQLLAGGAFGQGNIDASWGQGDFDNDGDFDGTDILAVVQGLAGEFPKNYAHDPSNGVPDVLINPATGNITLDTNGTTIGSIVMDSAAGIFNGPNSPMWDAPGDFAADIDTQISMPISFTNPGYTGVDDLGDGIIGDLPPGFDILADLTIKYLDPNGDLLDAEAHVVPEPSSIVLAAFGALGLLGYLRRRRRLS